MLLPKLQVVDLSKNKIKRFPTDFGNLINLKVLSIARNRITALPKYISDMKLLKILKLENNYITWPKAEISTCDDESKHFEWLQKLKLWLSENEVPRLETHITEAIQRYNVRESIPSSAENSPPSSPKAANTMCYIPLYQFENIWTIEFIKNLKTYHPSNRLIQSSYYILWASVEMCDVTNMLLSLIGLDRTMLATERELNHIEIEAKSLFKFIRMNSIQSCIVNQKTKVLVKHLRSLLQSVEKELSFDQTGKLIDMIHLQWKNCNLHMADAIECLQPSFFTKTPSLVDTILIQILKKINSDEKDGKELVNDCLETTTVETVVQVLELCKRLEYNELGLLLVQAARKQE
jgi:hypothetical protein